MNSGIKALKRVGKTLAVYRTGLHNYFDHSITSGTVEGLIKQNQNPQTAGLMGSEILSISN